MQQIDEIILASVDSTNLWAKRHFSSFDTKKMTCITADEQTHGIGTKNRSWHSPKGVNIYTTFVFSIRKHTHHITCMTAVACMSITNILLEKKLPIKIKWPNDILLNEKKMTGILCEVIFENDIAHQFLGIGINVNATKEDLACINHPATSLFIETKRLWDRNELLKKLQKQFLRNLDLFLEQDFAPFYNDYVNLLAYKNDPIIITDGKRKYEGRYHSLTKDAKINIILPDETIKTLASGNVSLRKKTMDDY